MAFKVVTEDVDTGCEVKPQIASLKLCVHMGLLVGVPFQTWPPEHEKRQTLETEHPFPWTTCSILTWLFCLKPVSVFSSLRQSMKANKAFPTGEWKEESTVFADVEPMDIEGTSARVYDCAGQVTITCASTFFLSGGGLGFQAPENKAAGMLIVLRFASLDNLSATARFARSPTRGCCRCS